MKFKEMPYKRPALDEVTAKLTNMIEKLQAAQDYGQAKEAFLLWEEDNRHLQTMGTLASIRHSIDTRDPFYEAEDTWWNQTSPQLEEYRNVIMKLFGVSSDKIKTGIISFSQKDENGNRLGGEEVRVRYTRI